MLQREFQERVAAFFDGKTSCELIFSHPLFWPGGASQFYRNLLRERLDAGCSVVSVTPCWDPQTQATVQVDLQRPDGSVQSFRATGPGILLQMPLQGISAIRVNNLHGLFFYFKSSVFTVKMMAEMMDLILKLRRAANASLFFYFHDFLPVCPRLFLVGPSLTYCDPEPGGKACEACLKEKVFWTTDVDHTIKMQEWRNLFRSFLGECSDFVFFSLSTLQIMEKVMPGIISGRMAKTHIQPHKLTLNDFEPLSLSPQEKMVIGVIGNIGVTKGVVPVLNLARFLLENRLPARIVVVGSLDAKNIPENITVTGAYEQKNLRDLIRMHGINLFYFPSIWPETFSFVALELQKLGLPVALYRLGAPADRMQHDPRASFIPDFSPQAAWQTLRALFEKFYGHEKKA